MHYVRAPVQRCHRVTEPLCCRARKRRNREMVNCDDRICAFFHASVTILDGWVEDKEATSRDHFAKGRRLQRFKGHDLCDRGLKKQPISDFLSDAIEDWKSRAKAGFCAPRLRGAESDGAGIRAASSHRRRQRIHRDYHSLSKLEKRAKVRNSHISLFSASIECACAFADDVRRMSAKLYGEDPPTATPVSVS